MKLITPQRAKEEVKRLQEYIELVESYEADTLEKWIVKEYAFTNSMVEVVKRANDRGFTNNGSLIDKKQTIRNIPARRVLTYGQIARVAGSTHAACQVVRILHSMSRKHHLPWHRVINSKGQISLQDDALYQE